MLFIDADHRFEAVRADFLEWMVHCRPGALCLFHDYFNIEQDGVRRFLGPAIDAGIIADVEYTDSIAHGRLRVTDRAEVERRLAASPARKALRFLKQGNARDPKFDFSLRRGWSSLSGGDRRTAARDGLLLIGLKPWRVDGWRLLACAAKANGKSD